MAGINKAILVGNVGRDPEIRSLNSGSQVANFTLATSETWRDKQSGERKEKTEWHKITVWQEGLVKVVSDYVRKGSKLYIEGKIETRKWTDQQGQERYSTEIVLQGFDGKIQLLDSRRDNNRGDSGDAYEEPHRGGGNGLYQAPASGGRTRRDDLADEIPF